MRSCTRAERKAARSQICRSRSNKLSKLSGGIDGKYNYYNDHRRADTADRVQRTRGLRSHEIAELNGLGDHQLADLEGAIEAYIQGQLALGDMTPARVWWFTAHKEGFEDSPWICRHTKTIRMVRHRLS